MANDDVIKVREEVDTVVDHIMKAKKSNRPIILLDPKDDSIWINPDQVNSVK